MSEGDWNELLGSLGKSLDPVSKEAILEVIFQNPSNRLLGGELPSSPSCDGNLATMLDYLRPPDSDTDASASPSSSPTASLLSSNISGHELGSYFAPCPLNDRWRNTGKAIRLSRRRPGEIHLSPLPSAYRIGLLKRCRDGYNFGSLLKLDDGLSSDEDFVYFNFDPSKYREVIIRKNGRRSICRPDSATTFTDWIKGFVFGTDCCKHRNSVWFYQANCVHDIMEEENRKTYTKDTFNRPDTMIKHLSKCKEVQREFPEVFWFCKAWIEAKPADRH
ncbi:hypothetical protein BT69DRAFT_1340410 [Atractiella rhizophila]|nr:hypothetical protein BT69DRAFT_1340410 [Atractiella rhizophila]